MYRGELLFFLLVVGIFSVDFLKDRVPHFFDFTTLPPKITQWELDSCTRTISVQAVAGGIPPYDFYVFKQDVLDSSNWQVYRLIKEQLPQISGLPPGTYRVKAVNEGVSSASFSTNILQVNFPADPEIEIHGANSLCSGESLAIALRLAHLEDPLPIRWTPQVLQAPEEGEILGYTSSPTISQFKISDSLVNTGKTLAKVSYQLQTLIDGCIRADTVEVLVNPQARIVASLSDSILCSGTDFAISLLPQSWGAVPMQVSWLAELLSGQVSDLVEGGQLTLPALASISRNLTNRGPDPARVRYTFFPYFNDCDGIAERVEVVVLPQPQVSPQVDLIVCAGDWVSVPEFTSNFTGDSIAYSWEVSDSSIGLSSGTGHRIPSFQAINNGPNSKQVLIAVTPRRYFKGVSCTGPNPTFSIAVRAPILFKEELSDYAGFEVSCAGAADGKIKIYLSGGILQGEEPNYTYSWTGPNGFSSSSDILEGIRAGEYNVRIATGTGNCVLEKTIMLTQPEPLWIQALSPSAGVLALACAGDASGKIQVEVGGGIGEKILQWTAKDGGKIPAGMENASLLEGLQRGNYLLSVRDENGCSIEKIFSFTEPEPLLLAQAKVDNLCFGQSSGHLSVVAYGGVGPYRYTWTGPNNFSSTVANPQNLVSGTYQVTVRDVNGCSITGATQTITEPAALTITNQVKVDNVCAQGATGSISITASGGTAPYSYTWTGPNNFSSTVANPQNLVSGTYQVTVRDANNCTALVGPQITITEPAQLALTQSQVNNVCFQGNTGSISITATGGTAPYTYAWTGPNGFTSTSEDLQNLVSGTYQVTVRDANNCTALVGPQITITEPAQLALTQSQVNNVCFQGNTGSISITASGGTAPYSYAWTGPNNFSSTVANPQNLVSGTYQVTVRDANNCTALVGPQITITEPAQLALTQSQVNNVCFQGNTGSISITASGGTAPYTYAWTGPNNFSSTVANPQNLVSGTYQVTVRDANNCTALVGPQITITEPAQLALTQSQVNNVCFQGNTGSISITPSGSTAPYSYAWTGPNGFTSTNEDLQNLVSGFYQVTVRDANGCTLTGAAQIITEPGPLAISALVKGETCAEAKDGRIALTPTGGTVPYQYSWDHGATGPVATGLSAGTYRVTVTDQGGCTQTAEYILLPVPVLRLEGTVTYQATQAPFQISALLQSDTQGGTPPYTYRWTSGQTSPSITVTESGTYTLQLKDATGCVQEKEFVVNLPLPLAIEVEVNTIPLCEDQGQESTLRVHVQDGLPPYQITWTMGSVTATGMQFITRESGLVEVEVRDALGLVEKRAITLLPRLTGPLDFEQSFESQTQFQADLVGFKGVFRPLAAWPHQVISWDFGDGIRSSEPSPTHTYTRKGSYSVTLTVLDNSGCLITQAKELDILDYFIEIPNVFTPNGDNLNDTFFPKFRFINNLQLQVMNKWGELIFRSRGLDDPGWDGMSAGQKASEGIYVYKLSYQVPDGRVFTSSSTFLLAR